MGPATVDTTMEELNATSKVEFALAIRLSRCWDAMSSSH